MQRGVREEREFTIDLDILFYIYPAVSSLCFLVYGFSHQNDCLDTARHSTRSIVNIGDCR